MPFTTLLIRLFIGNQIMQHSWQHKQEDHILMLMGIRIPAPFNMLSIVSRSLSLAMPLLLRNVLPYECFMGVLMSDCCRTYI